MRVALSLAAALVTAGLSCAPLALADGDPPESTEARLRRLEEALSAERADRLRLQSDFDAYRRENPSATALTADQVQSAIAAYLGSAPAGGVELVGAEGGSRGLRWGGYLHWLYEDEEGDPSQFELLRLVLACDGSITDRIDFSAEIEIENGGVTDEFEGEVSLEKAEVTFHCCDALIPKVGWLLVPFGRYNRYHDDPINDFSDRPFVATNLVPTGFGQPGIGVEGSMPFGCGHVFSYDVSVTNGHKDEFTNDEGVREARQNGDENRGKQVWGRAGVRWNTRFLDTLETGVSGTYGLYDQADRNAISGFAADFLLRKGALELKGEYVAYDYARNASDPVGAIEGQSALWLEADWHFFPGYWSCARNCLVTDTSLFTLGVRYQSQDLDDHVRGASFEDDLRAWSIGLNYRITERTVFRIDRTWLDAWSEKDRARWAFSFSTYF